MGHARWIFLIEDKESQGTDRENIRTLHQTNIHIHVNQIKEYQS